MSLVYLVQSPCFIFALYDIGVSEQINDDEKTPRLSLNMHGPRQQLNHWSIAFVGEFDFYRCYLFICFEFVSILWRKKNGVYSGVNISVSLYVTAVC